MEAANAVGHFGMGQKHLPVPWSRMQYSPTLEAYEINLTDEELAKAPSYAADKDFDCGDRTRKARITGRAPIGRLLTSVATVVARSS